MGCRQPGRRYCADRVGDGAPSDRVAALGVAFVVIGLASFLRVLGARGGLVGFAVSAVLLIGNGLSGTASDAPARAAEFSAGGLVALVLVLLAGIADAPVRRAIERIGWRDLPRRATHQPCASARRSAP